MMKKDFPGKTASCGHARKVEVYARVIHSNPMEHGRVKFVAKVN